MPIKIDWKNDTHEWWPKLEDIQFTQRLNSVPLDQIERYVQMKKSVKKGDKIVCINNQDYDMPLNKIYEVYQVFIDENWLLWVQLKNHNQEKYGDYDFYPFEPYFITLKEQRKQKLRSLNKI